MTTHLVDSSRKQTSQEFLSAARRLADILNTMGPNRMLIRSSGGFHKFTEQLKNGATSQDLVKHLKVTSHDEHGWEKEYINVLSFLLLYNYQNRANPISEEKLCQAFECAAQLLSLAERFDEFYSENVRFRRRDLFTRNAFSSCHSIINTHNFYSENCQQKLTAIYQKYTKASYETPTVQDPLFYALAFQLAEEIADEVLEHQNYSNNFEYFTEPIKAGEANSTQDLCYLLAAGNANLLSVCLFYYEDSLQRANIDSERFFKTLQKCFSLFNTLDIMEAALAQQCFLGEVSCYDTITSIKRRHPNEAKAIVDIITTARSNKPPSSYTPFSNHSLSIPLELEGDELKQEIDAALKDQASLDFLLTLDLPKSLQIGNQTLLSYLLLNKCGTDFLIKFFDAGFNTLSANGDTYYRLVETQEEVSHTELVAMVLNRLNKIQSLEVKEAAVSYYATTQSLYQLYLFTEVVEMLENKQADQMQEAWFQLCANMLFINEQDRPLNTIMTSYGNVISKHIDCFSELFLLCNPSPSEQQSTSKNTIRKYYSLKSESSWMLQRIGCLNFSFSKLRWDATRGARADGSLIDENPLVRFGADFLELPESDNSRELYHIPENRLNFSYQVTDLRGSLVEKTINSSTFFILSQSFYIVGNSEHGWLLIKNASPDFDRSSFSKAYYHINPGLIDKYSLKIDDFLSSPELWESYDNFYIIPVPWYDTPKQGNFLLDELTGLFQYFSALRFDTSVSAWHKSEEDQVTSLFGGHLSQEFSFYQQHAQSLQVRFPDKDFSFAFVRHEYPAFQSYQFTTADGLQHDQLRLADPEVDLALSSMVNGECPIDLLERSGVRSFMQMGFDNRAELIIQAD